MGQKELLRGKLMEQVVQGQVTLKEAAIKLKICYRQASRIKAAYERWGEKALIHGNYDRPSNRKTDEKTLKKVLEIYEEKYSDFGPTFAAEKLAEKDGINIDHDVLRRELMKVGLWKRKRRRSEYRHIRWMCAGGTGGSVLGNSFSLTVAITIGLKAAVQNAV